MAAAPTAQTLRLRINLNEGMPGREHFTVESTPAPTEGDVPEGGLLVQALCYSADPYQRSSLRSDRPGGKKPGDAITGFLSGRVIASRNPKWTAGELFGASLPLCSIQVVAPDALAKTPIWRLDIPVERISLGVGALGMPGATAWGGFLDVLRPQEGETVLVTAASGAVGSLVCQLAKHLKKCRVIATAGGPEKCAALLKLGVDVAIDYKVHDTASLTAALREAAPKGLDCVFENVGGAVFDAAFANLGQGGRIAVCGGIASYNAAAPILQSINPMAMIYTNQRIEGFVCGRWLTGAVGSCHRDLKQWVLTEGWLRADETLFPGGLEVWGDAFQSLFTGMHVGKVVVMA